MKSAMPRDQRVFDARLHAPAAPLLLGLLDGFLAIVRVGTLGETIGGVRAAKKEHVLDEFQQFRIDVVVYIELPGIDDAHAETSLNRVVEERAIHGAAHRARYRETRSSDSRRRPR